MGRSMDYPWPSSLLPSAPAVGFRESSMWRSREQSTVGITESWLMEMGWGKRRANPTPMLNPAQKLRMVANMNSRKIVNNVAIYTTFVRVQSQHPSEVYGVVHPYSELQDPISKTPLHRITPRKFSLQLCGLELHLFFFR